jgi:cysteine desulfurase
MENRIYYFDNYEITPYHPKIKKIINEGLNRDFLLPNNYFPINVEIEEEKEKVKELIKKSLNTKEGFIYFFPNAIYLHSILFNSIFKKEGIVIRETINCGSVRVSLNKLEKENKINVLEVNVDKKGYIKKEELIETVERIKNEKKLKLISINHINHISGTIQNIKELIKEVKEVDENIKIHLNTQWSYFKEKINLKNLNVDYITLSFYKINGPLISALFSKERLNNYLLNTKQEIFEKFLENSKLKATKEIIKMKEKKWEEDLEKTYKLQKKLHEKIQEIEKVNLLGPKIGERAKDVLTYFVKGVEGEALAMDLSLKNIIVSTNSTCANPNLRMNYELLKLTNNAEIVNSTIRISFSPLNTKEEVEILSEEMKNSIERLRKLSQRVIR